jgi:hypothetical protein
MGSYVDSKMEFGWISLISVRCDLVPYPHHPISKVERSLIIGPWVHHGLFWAGRKMQRLRPGEQTTNTCFRSAHSRIS